MNSTQGFIARTALAVALASLLATAGCAGWQPPPSFTAADFQRIEVDRWSRADVERSFGPPAWVERVGSWSGPVLTYRWRDRNDPMFYVIYLDAQGVVRRAHPAMEFINAPNDRS